jgi:hypothetical protein
MPRVEDTIPGTPPPIYRDYFKIKDAAEAWCYTNPVFECEIDHDSRTNSTNGSQTMPNSNRAIDDSSNASSSDYSAHSSLSDVEVFSTLRRNTSIQLDTLSIYSSTTLPRVPTINDHRRTLRIRRGSRALTRSVSMISRTSIHSIAERLPTYAQAIFLMERRKREAESAVEAAL